MISIEHSGVGAVATARMLADGVVSGAHQGSWRPMDTPDDAGVRAYLLRSAVPPRGALGGIHALWVHGALDSPPITSKVDICVWPGVHPDPPSGWSATTWSFTASADAMRAATVIAGVRVVTVEHAIVQALRRAELGPAVQAAALALTRGLVDADAVSQALAATKANGSQRASNAWRAIVSNHSLGASGGH